MFMFELQPMLLANPKVDLHPDIIMFAFQYNQSKVSIYTKPVAPTHWGANTEEGQKKKSSWTSLSYALWMDFQKAEFR